MRYLRVHLFIAVMFAALAAFSFSHIGCSDGGEDDTANFGCESECGGDCYDVRAGVCICDPVECDDSM